MGLENAAPGVGVAVMAAVGAGAGYLAAASAVASKEEEDKASLQETIGRTGFMFSPQRRALCFHRLLSLVYASAGEEKLSPRELAG